jgi:hypothetical protein
MLVDQNGHAKGLPLNRRAGELYGTDAIAGDVGAREKCRGLVVKSAEVLGTLNGL